MRKIIATLLIGAGLLAGCSTDAHASTKQDRQIAALVKRVTTLEKETKETRSYADGIFSCLYAVPVNPYDVQIGQDANGDPITFTFYGLTGQHPIDRMVLVDEFCLDGNAWRESEGAVHGLMGRTQWLSHPPRTPKP